MKGEKKIKIIKPLMVVLLLILILVVFAVCRNGLKNTESSEQKSNETVSRDERIEEAEESGDTALLVADMEASSGDTVTVPVTLVNNPGILGMSLTLSYDESIMTLKRVENGEAFSGVLNMSSSKNLENGCKFLWDGISVSDEQIKDGVVLNLEFEVNGSAENEKTPIVITADVDGIVDNDLNPIEITIDNGYLLINQ